MVWKIFDIDTNDDSIQNVFNMPLTSFCIDGVFNVFNRITKVTLQRIHERCSTLKELYISGVFIELNDVLTHLSGLKLDRLMVSEKVHSEFYTLIDESQIITSKKIADQPIIIDADTLVNAGVIKYRTSMIYSDCCASTFWEK